MNNIRLHFELRGVMTCFRPLTAEDVMSSEVNDLTWKELANCLTQNGLDISLAVHDPSRKLFSTFYADYDRGLYGGIPLERQALHDDIPLFKLAAHAKGGIMPELESQNWKSYYSKCVPLPMLIYDFQRRYLDIPPEEVFSVWHDIYKRIDYSNGMWQPEVLEYIFAYAPPPELPEPDSDGLITVYRGMGELSTSPEQAISWSTHPGNALWFAIRCGHGTHIATTRIRPEQVAAYDANYYNENEVIVRPGSITEYRYEDMISVSKATMMPLLMTALPDFTQYGPQARKLGYQEESPVEYHGLKHILRVLLLSLIYFYSSGDDLSDTDRQILIYFSLLHDIGRMDDSHDMVHGRRSVALIHSQNLRIKGLKMSKRNYRIAELLISYHCFDDFIGEDAIRCASFLSQREKEHVVHLYHICKDMDGLDRVRFNGLDYRQLRTEYGRKMPLVAGCIFEEDEVARILDMS